MVRSYGFADRKVWFILVISGRWRYRVVRYDNPYHKDYWLRGSQPVVIDNTSVSG
jgi:hypothetical protein